MLKAEGIWLLLSPPGTPEYNGACEAGIGSLTTRANHESFRNDCPGECPVAERHLFAMQTMPRATGLSRSERHHARSA
jgi:hypothetical protein